MGYSDTGIFTLNCLIANKMPNRIAHFTGICVCLIDGVADVERGLTIGAKCRIAV
jgi:hypothetical protein